MKKLLALCLTAILCLCCLASCSSTHEENTWFSDEKLTECLVDDLPTIEKDYVNHNGGDIYAKLTDSEFEAYAKSVYDYLLSREYEYLGTRGEQKDTLAGVFTTYYFEPADELESFWIEGNYIFVFSDGTVDENGDVEFIVLIIYSTSTDTLEYGNKEFTYNTKISLRQGSEAPLGGFYVLKEVEEGNYFIRNQAGAEWLREITAENIAEIKIIDETVGIAPGNLKSISSTTDEAVIARIFEEYYWLDTTPISQMDGQIDGGSGVAVKFILKNGTAKGLYINNGNYLDTNGDYFELLSTPKFKDTDNAIKAYGFITYIGTGTVYDKDNNPVCKIPMDELVFHYDLDLDLPDLPPYDMVIKTEFGELEFIAPDTFYMETGEACVLVGKNLDELIAEYSVE